MVCFVNTYSLGSDLSRQWIALYSLRTTGAWLFVDPPGISKTGDDLKIARAENLGCKVCLGDLHSLCSFSLVCTLVS